VTRGALEHSLELAMLLGQCRPANDNGLLRSSMASCLGGFGDRQGRHLASAQGAPLGDDRFTRLAEQGRHRHLEAVGEAHERIDGHVHSPLLKASVVRDEHPEPLGGLLLGEFQAASNLADP
jgi:hypothetical protein